MNDRRLRLALVLEATTGGTRRHLDYLLSTLDRDRFEPFFLCSDLRDPAFAEDLRRHRESGVATRVIPMERAVSPLADLRALAALVGALRQIRPDIVHAHSSKAGFLGRLAARICRVPCVIYTPHSFAFQYQPDSRSGSAYRRLEALAARWQHHYLFVSESERHEALRAGLGSPSHYGLPTLPNALPHVEWTRPFSREAAQEVRARHGFAPDHLVIGMVAHFRPQKDHNCLLRAIPAVAEKCPNVRFLLVGDGPLLPQARALAAGLGVADRVAFAGAQDAMRPFYAAFDVFVLTSLWEGHSYAVLEAMACGLPVVATRAPGLGSVLRDGETGLLAEVGNPGDLSATLVRLATDEALRERLGRAARAAFDGTMDLQEWASKYSEIYADALGSARA